MSTAVIEEEEGAERWYMGFVLREEGARTIQFGVDVASILEAIEVDRLQALPELDRPFVGLAEVRGVPVPVLDLADALLGPGREPWTRYPARILLVHVDQSVVGVLVADTVRIREHLTSDTYPNATNNDRPYMVGMIKEEDCYVQFVDLPMLVRSLLNGLR